MSTRRRKIAWGIVGLFILIGLGGGIAWHVRRSTGPQLLIRARLALRAGKLDSALSLCEDYIAKYPDDWHGYFAKADALCRQGKYEQARPVLAKAAGMDGADATTIVLRQADANALKAVQAIGTALTAARRAPASPGAEAGQPGLKELPVLREGIGNLQVANRILADHAPKDEKAGLDIREAVGLNHDRIRWAQVEVIGVLTREADAAEKSGDPEKAKASRDRAEYEKAQARPSQSAKQAIEALAFVVKKDRTRARPAETLIRLCLAENDSAALAAAREALLDPNAKLPDPAPGAVVLLASMEARTSRDSGGSREAIALVRRLLKKHPGNPDLALERAEIILRSADPGDANMTPPERLAKAEDLAQQALKTRPRDARARLLHAQVLLAQSRLPIDAKDTKAKAEQQKKLSDAEAELFRLKTEFPRWAEAHYLYARAAEATGKTELARDAMRAVTLLMPGHSEARKQFAKLLIEGGFHEQALGDARACYEADPNDPEALDLFVKAARWTDQLELARTALRRAHQSTGSDGKPADPVLLMVAADGYRLLGDQGESDRVVDTLLKAAEKSAPASTAAARAVARALVRRERQPEAEKLLTDFLAQSPNDPRLCFDLASLHRSAGRGIQAEEYYRRAIRLSEREPSHRLGLAGYLIDLGELDEAEDVLQPILARSIDAELLRLRIELLKGRPVDAQAQAILRRPDAGKRFGLPLAMIFLANGQPKRCEEICLTGLEENPSDVDLRAPLAEAYLMTGERKKCIEQWEKTVSAKPNSLPAYERLAMLFLGEGILDANTDDAATQPSDSGVRLSMDQLTKALDDAHKRLVTISGAKQHLVDVAVAGQYARLRQYDKASELYAKVVGDAATEDPLRYRAQMLRAVMLSRSGKPDEALRELDRLIGALAKSPSWKSRATYAKADLLAAMLAAGRRRLAALNRQEESPARQQAIEAAQRSTQNLQGQVKVVLGTLCKEAEAEGDARTLRQAAGLWVRTGDPEGALSACNSVENLLPKDPRSYALRAEVLTVAGKPEKVAALYRKAIDLQPGDFRLYTALAAAQERQGRPMDAISTLERLDKVSQSGRVYSLHLQGTVLSNWGLQKQAVAKFEQLAQLPYGANPQLQWSLAGSLARLGSADKALAAIEEIPEYARDYVPAQLLKARLTEGVDKKRAVLRALAAKRPADERVVLEEMSLLLSEDRPAEAVAAFEAFRNSKEIAGRFPPRSSALALRAATRAGDLAKARELVAAIAERNPTPVWQLAAQLLCMEDEPATVRKGLPEPAKAGLFPATIGLCLARRAGDGEAVKQWAGRLDELDKALNRYRGASFPAALRLLCALLAGDKPLAALCVARLGSDPRGAAAKELADHADGSPRSTDEIIRLVGVFLARQVQLDDLARQWAMEALKARPACLWAAVEVSQTASPLTDLKEALALVKPPDCELAQLLRAEVHLREKQPKEAAAIFDDLAGKSGTPDPGYLLRQAMALEAAGELPTALDLYQQVWRLTKSPAAANNAACLVMQSSPKDAAKLAEARQWMDEALKTAAASPYLEDTAGWVAHLQGRDADALPLLRRAVKGLPESPDVQYHLGTVEAKAGDAQLARWHLEAAVDLGKKLRAEGKEIAKATEEAIRSAEAQLAALGQPKGTNP